RLSVHTIGAIKKTKILRIHERLFTVPRRSNREPWPSARRVRPGIVEESPPLARKSRGCFPAVRIHAPHRAQGPAGGYKISGRLRSSAPAGSVRYATNFRPFRTGISTAFN